ncbi:hypothetical protein [Chondromyces crocatus]|uniref:Uncharacterized protein n=1 Tax=Chondromyces crocatus TaxID=52 RepID=A0A0K1ERD8_CHOCO|nr:hypothetical protein [Chondromyces crocatus]AKT43495.1 uncharacterized protein CMC5_077270 [Chondromyces crocatus]
MFRSLSFLPLRLALLVAATLTTTQLVAQPAPAPREPPGLPSASTGASPGGGPSLQGGEQASSSNGQPPPAQGHPPPGVGYPPPGYGQPPPGYGYPPPGYGYPPPGYGYPPQGYGYPPPGYGYPPGYGPNAPPPGDAPISMKRRSVGMMVGGIVLSSVGAVLTTLGTAMSLSSNSYDCPPCVYEGPCPSCEESSPPAGPIVLIVGGLLAVGGGIPLIVYGAKRVPVIDGDAEAPEAALLLGPGGLTLRGQF